MADKKTNRGRQLIALIDPTGKTPEQMAEEGAAAVEAFLAKQRPQSDAPKAAKEAKRKKAPGKK